MHTTKMSGLGVTCFYLYVVCLVQMTEGDAFISIRFVTFHNPRGLGSNGHCCEGKWGICLSACDHSFEICLDQMDGTIANYKSCAFGSTNSGEISDKNDITFGSKIGRLANPIVWKLGLWPGSVLLKINVVDVDDSNNNDHVAYLNRQLSIQPLANHQETKFWLTNRVRYNQHDIISAGDFNFVEDKLDIAGPKMT
ncbi:neurogenic locus protein delta-like [Physella acuta]|uniref:neurogenic locus protein delta-like n=1 Tax=Physella acuta TaxID=109671 RepID=UPI0027DB458D|nr:neurogenic locus protein delta-like [Physella acuta]